MERKKGNHTEDGHHYRLFTGRNSFVGKVKGMEPRGGRGGWTWEKAEYSKKVWVNIAKAP